ncbi:hypothetical protein NGM37_22630, partial [Streptomyces sp. TRM76130]|nr:hypothetical protein [Streptomyces sp. TRM76130]
RRGEGWPVLRGGTDRRTDGGTATARTTARQRGGRRSTRPSRAVPVDGGTATARTTARQRGGRRSTRP